MGKHRPHADTLVALDLLAAGYTLKQAAAHLGMPKDTLWSRVNKMRLRVHATTVTQLVVIHVKATEPKK